MMRLIAAMALAAAAATAAHPTAVFTLDVKHPELVVDSQRSLQATFDEWSNRCNSVEGGAVFVLECPAVFQDLSKPTKPATVALFRDLDEVVYIAGCPIFEDKAESRDPKEHETQPEPELVSELERDCLEIEPGHTFSAEVESKRMKIVIRGKQLPMTVYKVIPPERKISSPYELRPSHVPVQHVGPETSTVYEPLKGPEPRWEPPAVARPLVQGREARRSLHDPGPAKTSLRSGVVHLSCSTGVRDIWLDGAFMGQAPLAVPLPAARHELRAVAKGRRPIRSEFRIDAGDTLRLDACKP